MTFKRIILGTTLGGLLVASTPSVAQVYPLSENSWNNPEFRERFMGSYGVNTDVNPDVTPSEKALFDEVVPLISESVPAAIERLRRGINADSSAAFDFILGNLLYQEGQMEAAVAAYQDAIRKFPNYYRAYYNGGRAFVNLGQYDQGLEYLSKALELQPGGGTLYGLIGYCHLNTGSYASALDAYRMAIMLDPKSRDWKLGKLKCHEALGQTEEAIGVLYEFIAANPNDPQWWKFQANQFVQSGDIARAAANLSMVNALGAADGPTLTLLGDIYVNEGLSDPAAEIYAQAMEKADVRPAKILQVVETFVQLNELEKAKDLLRQAETTVFANLDEDRQIALLNLKARVALAEDDTEAAASLLEEVVNRDPMNGKALLTLADFHVRGGDLAQAEFYADSALKLDDFAHRASLVLAQIKVQQADYREAAKHLRRAQQLDPKEYVADYLTRVEQAAMRM